MRLSHLLGIALLVSITARAGSLLKPNDRIIFVGDSITAQSVGSPQGYYHQFTNALHHVYPEHNHEVIGLGFSGHTVYSWADSIEPDSRTKAVPANTGGFEVRAAFSKPADIVFILLGMNDILCPTVRDDDAALLAWKEKYRSLLRAIRRRVTPREVILCEITPLTEDPRSPKNRVRDRMTDRVAELAAEENCRTAATGAEVFRVLRAARAIDAGYHLIPDTVHPSQPFGHSAIALGMVTALQDDGLRGFFEDVIDRTLATLPPTVGAASRQPIRNRIPACWRVLCGPDNGNAWSAQRAYQPTNSVPFMESELVAGRHFTEPFVQDGQTCVWQIATPDTDYTAGDDPNTVNPYSLTFGSPNDVLYAARWIYSAKARPVTVELTHRTFSATLGFVVWLNGERVLTADLNRNGKNKVTGPATLQAGWNRLLVRNDHLEWQRQFACALLPETGDTLDDLLYSTLPRAD